MYMIYVQAFEDNEDSRRHNIRNYAVLMRPAEKEMPRNRFPTPNPQAEPRISDLRSDCEVPINSQPLF